MTRTQVRAVVVFGIVGLLVTNLFSCVAGGLIGAALGSRDAYHARFLHEEQVLLELLQGRDAYHDVRVEETSQGHAYLEGTVPSTDDLERLREEVKDKLGGDKAAARMGAVDVRAK